MNSAASVGIGVSLEGLDQTLQQIGLLQQALGALGQVSVSPYNPLATSGNVAQGSSAGHELAAPAQASGPSSPYTPAYQYAAQSSPGQTQSITIQQVQTLTVAAAAVVNIYGSGSGVGLGAAQGGGGPVAGGQGVSAGNLTPPSAQAAPTPGAPIPGGGPTAVFGQVTPGLTVPSLGDFDLSGMGGGKASPQQPTPQQPGPSPQEPRSDGSQLPPWLARMGTAYGALQVANVIAGVGGQAVNYGQSGGDMTRNAAMGGFLTSLPFVGGLFNPFAMQLSKEDTLKGTSSLNRMMGFDDSQITRQTTGGLVPTAPMSELDKDISPTMLSAIFQMALGGLKMPQQYVDRFAVTDSNATDYIHPMLREVVKDDYILTRRSPFAMGMMGYDDPSGLPMGGRMGYLQAATGDYDAAARTFGIDVPLGTPGAADMVSNSRRWGATEATARMWQMQTDASLGLYGAQGGALQAAGLTRENRAGYVGSLDAERRALADQTSTLQKQLEVVAEQRQGATAAGATEALEALRYRETQLKAQLSGTEARAAGISTTQANLQLPLELQSQMSRSSFERNVLETIPGSFGNIQGVMQQQMRQQEEAAAAIMADRERMKSTIDPTTGKPQLTPQAEFTFQNRLQEVGMQQAQTFEQLSQGWQNRLISTVMGNPGNFSLEGRGMSFMDATMAGVRGAAFGATPDTLPFFLRQQGVVGLPGKLPGTQGMPYFNETSGGFGPHNPLNPGTGNGFIGDPTIPTASTSPTGLVGGIPTPVPVGMSGGTTSGTTAAGHAPTSFLPPGRPKLSGPTGATPSVATGRGFDPRIRPGESMENYTARRDAGLGMDRGPIPTVNIDGRSGRNQPLGWYNSQYTDGRPDPGQMAGFGASLTPPTRTPSKPKDAGAGGDAAAGTVKIQVEIVLKDLNGKELGRKTVDGKAGDVAEGVAQGGLGDSLSQFGVRVATQ